MAVQLDQQQLQQRRNDRILRVYNARAVAWPQRLIEDQLPFPHPQPGALAQWPEVERPKEAIGLDCGLDE